jgi:hypothetical protein
MIFIFFAFQRARIVADCECECNLLYELGLPGISDGPSSNQLKDDFYNVMRDEMKKLKAEMLEIDVRRQEFTRSVADVDQEAIASSNTRRNSSWLPSFVKSKKEPVEIQNEKLTQLQSECDTRMIELSNIFLNEKIDLIFQHNKQVDDLNRRISYLSSQLTRLGQTSIPYQVAYVDADGEAQTDLDLTQLADMEKRLNCPRADNWSQTMAPPVSMHAQTQSDGVERTAKTCQTDLYTLTNSQTQSDVSSSMLLEMEDKISRLKSASENWSQTNTPILVDSQVQLDSVPTMARSCQTEILTSFRTSQTQSDLNTSKIAEMELKMRQLKDVTENWSQTQLTIAVDSGTQFDFVPSTVKSCQTDRPSFKESQTQSDLNGLSLSEMEAKINSQASSVAQNGTQTDTVHAVQATLSVRVETKAVAIQTDPLAAKTDASSQCNDQETIRTKIDEEIQKRLVKSYAQRAAAAAATANPPTGDSNLQPKLSSSAESQTEVVLTSENASQCDRNEEMATIKLEKAFLLDKNEQTESSIDPTQPRVKQLVDASTQSSNLKITQVLNIDLIGNEDYQSESSDHLREVNV